MGWPAVIRVWLPQWIADRDGVLRRIDDAVSEAAAAATAERAAANNEAAVTIGDPEPSPALQRAATVPAPTEPAPTVRPQAAAPRQDPEPFEPYEPRPVAERARIDELTTSPTVQDAARRSMADVIAAEGPVEVQRLAKLACQCFGLLRVSADHRESMLRYLPDGYRVTTGNGTRFVWPQQRDPGTWRGFRQVASSADREFHEIAPEEIANAMAYASEIRHTEGDEQLYRATRELLGYGRTPQAMRAGLERVLRWAVDTGRLPGHNTMRSTS